MLVLYTLLLMGPAAEEARPLTLLNRLSLLRLLPGEEICYDAYIHKAGIWFHVGEATFKVEKRKGPTGGLLLRGIAKGGKFGYHIRMLWESYLDGKTLLPTLSVNTKTGSERRFERYLFQKGEVLYFKKKHCHRPDCKNPAHFVRKTKWFGPIPVGKETVHCPGCKDLRHYIWRLIWRHKVNEPFLDMLSAVYAARTSTFRPGASFIVPVVKSRDRWHVKVTAAKEEKVKVSAGTFDCYKIILEPHNVGDRPNAKPKFSGLFGIQGTISIWVDKVTRVPVRIKGSIPFAFLTLYCDVQLKRATGTPEAFKLAANDILGRAPAAQ